MLDGQTAPEVADEALAGPGSVHTAADLTQALEMLRRRAARGTRRSRISLDDIAARSNVPRSTVHSYLRGVRLPPPDVLDAIVVALGAHPHEQREWAHALERVVADMAAAGNDRALAAPPGLPVGPVPHLLPMAPQGFAARDTELATLEHLVAPAWTEPPAPAVLIGLCGTGGVGKTALALTFAHEVAAHFPDGQLWVDLRGFGPGQPVDASTALTRLLTALGVDVSTMDDDVDVRAGAYRSALDGRRVLVVLDNARDAAQVRALLPGSPGCATLVTSRSNLRTLVVSEGAHRVEVARLSVDDASLLAETDTHVETGAGSGPALRALVEACDGLPLALRILRERLTGADPAAVGRLAEQVRDRRNLLRELDLDEDDRGLTAVIQSSYEALPADLARLFRNITLVGVPSIDVEVAAAAGGIDASDAVRQLDRLAARSLLDPVGNGSYRLHDLLAAFAEARSESEDDPVDVTRAVTSLANYYIDRLTELSGIINPKQSTGGRAVADKRFATVAAATDWLVAALPAIAGLAANNRRSSDPEPVWKLLIRTYYVAEDHVGTTCLDSVFSSAAEEAHERGDAIGECRMRQLEGIAAATRGDTDAARTSFERAIELSFGLEDLNRRATAIGNLGRLEIRTGRLTRALRLQEQALELHRQAGRRDHLITLSALADLHLQVGEMDASRRVRTKVLGLSRERDDPNMQATSLYHLGGLALSCEDLPAARRAAVECTAAAAEAGVSNAVLSAHVLAAAVALAAEDLDEAQDQIRLALAVPVSDAAEQIVDLHVIAGRVLAASGQAEAALAEHRLAVATARQMAVRFQETIAVLNLARSLRRVGQHREARAQVECARALAAECGFVRLEGHADQLLELLD